MPIYHAGWPWIISALCVTGILGASAFKTPSPGLSALLTLSALFAFFLLLFFRNPKRSPNSEELSKLGSNELPLLSPADGTITDIAEIVPSSDSPADRPAPLIPSYPHPLIPSFIRIGIFLSPLNCHIQRSPVESTIKKVERRKGRFLPAYKPQASPLNASTTIEASNPILGDYRVRQITGFLARRILTTAAPGMVLQQGQSLGMILLGSRVELEVPKQKIALLATKGQRVWAGHSVLGKYRKE